MIRQITGRAANFSMPQDNFRMHRVIQGIVVALLSVSLCTQTPALRVTHAQSISQNQTACVTNYDPATDYFPEKMQADRAQGFDITYHNNYKVLRTKVPWPGSKESFTYVLVQCGTPAPKDPELAQAPVISVPIKSVVALSTTYLPHLVDLGVVDTLVGVDTFDFINTPAVLALIKANKLIAVGSGASINVEQLIDKKPDLVLAYGSGSPDYDSHPKLIEAGIKVALNGEFVERDPLGRAEWIKFTAAFYNAEGKANAFFDKTAAEYTRLAGLVKSVKTRPSVLPGAPYKDTWYVPGGNTFAAALIRDAGATYAWADDPSTDSLALKFEVVLDKAQNADFWINPGIFDSLADLTKVDDRFANFAAFKAGRVWNNNLRQNVNGGNDYYENGVTHPQDILADMIAILHPEVLPDHKFVYYKQLK
jgi:iron complex transport system substrate-binding protein